MEWIALILFLVVLIVILLGYKVAFVLGGVSIIIGSIALGPDIFRLLPSRYMGVVSNYVLLAVPLFVFMGIMFQKSGLAQKLMENMSILFGKRSGGLALSTLIVGTLLAASTGIVGATVITMGLIGLPVMLKHKYDPGFASGSIAAAGTLGQVIPPSIILILLGSVLNVSVGKLFAAAVVPGILLVGGYAMYILIYARLNPDKAGRLYDNEIKVRQTPSLTEWIESFGMPLLLIVSVLGSIFAGIASPTEAAALGAIGASLLALLRKKLSWAIIRDTAMESMHITAMVFFILLGATTFSLVFRGLGGDLFLAEIISNSNLGFYGFLILVMVAVFIAGFFIDVIEIIFIFVPVVAPIFKIYDANLLWVGILLAVNLQTSFLTPPFGFSLFYLKGVTPPEVKTHHLYRGVIPFLLIQLMVLVVAILWPDFILMFQI